MNELELLKRRLKRERAARKQAELILESKALELYKANELLRKLNESLEDQIAERTNDLLESETKYRNVIEQATDIIYSTDDKGYFTFINPLGVDAFGYKPKEILGRRYIDFVLDEYKEELFNYYTKFRDEGLVSGYYEFPIRSKNGDVHWIGQNVNRVKSKGGNFYFNAVARDITLRKNAENELESAQKALAQSEIKYRSVLENMELGLMEVDTNGVIIRVYERFCKMTGYSKQELIGKDAINTLVVKGYEEILRKQDANRLKKESGVYEVKIRRKDGKHIWVLISGAPFFNQKGEVIGSLGIHFEITERKELESNLKIARQKAVAAQKAEQQFLANMSHEIRTPLNAIIGMSHLLKDTILDDKQQEFVEILSDSASLLKGLVSDILDISKIDSGLAEINESAFDMNSFTKRLIKTFELRAQEKGIILTASIPCDKTCIVSSDKQWLNQIFINLLSNAIKFTPSGSVNLIAKKLKEKENTSLFYFEVSDTGIGMNESEVETIFTSFKQANKNVRKEFGGTGLGLSIASRLVAMLGGELEVESIKGKGSRFFFSLNLKSANEEELVSRNFDEIGRIVDKKVKLLIVEDNFMNQKYISSLLHKWNIAFDIADNGLIAVEKYKLQHYDLIFMDLSMPVMDGYEATNIIRSLPGNQVPIIALTASTFLSKKELALQAGMTDFLAKPFTPEELTLMLLKHLSRKALVNTDSKKIASDIVELDRKKLNSLYGGDQDYALDMFKTYRSIIDAELETLESEVNSGNDDAVKKQVHKIKPMFSMVGLQSISDLCEQVETALNTQEHSLVISKVERIIQKAKKSNVLVDQEIELIEKQ